MLTSAKAPEYSNLSRQAARGVYHAFCRSSFPITACRFRNAKLGVGQSFNFTLWLLASRTTSATGVPKAKQHRLMCKALFRWLAAANDQLTCILLSMISCHHLQVPELQPRQTPEL